MPWPTRRCISLCVSGFTLALGCATMQPTPTAADPVGVHSHGRKSDVLDRGEIESVRVNNAFEAVMRLRPEFVQHRGQRDAANGSGGVPTVYVNGVRQGGPDMLRSIPVSAIFEIRYFTAASAADSFGPYHSGSVIAVRTSQ